jgi:hypothetical protein
MAIENLAAAKPRLHFLENRSNIVCELIFMPAISCPDNMNSSGLFQVPGWGSRQPQYRNPPRFTPNNCLSTIIPAAAASQRRGSAEFLVKLSPGGEFLANMSEKMATQEAANGNLSQEAPK